MNEKGVYYAAAHLYMWNFVYEKNLSAPYFQVPFSVALCYLTDKI